MPPPWKMCMHSCLIWFSLIVGVLSLGQNASAQTLNNDDIVKMVQAKVPDSVVIKKITSSSCEFDTSPDALIKLKQAGVSESVLQAIVDCPPAPPPPGPDCGDYSACISAGNTALGSSQWDDAITAFQVASTLDASKPDAWAGLGNAYLASNRNEEAAAMWDKALSVGGPLTFAACHARSFNSCEMGNLVLGPKDVSFASAGGQEIFTVPPSQVTSAKLRDVNIMSTHYVHLTLKVGSKNYMFQFAPFGVSCETTLSMRCPEQGTAQQLVLTNYIVKAISKLAS